MGTTGSGRDRRNARNRRRAATGKTEVECSKEVIAAPGKTAPPGNKWVNGRGKEVGR